MAMPFLVPARLGKPAPARGYSLAQLGYRYTYESGADYVAGALYEIAGLPAWNFTQRLPLSRRGGQTLFPLLSPAMMIRDLLFSLCHLPRQSIDLGGDPENRIQISIPKAARPHACPGSPRQRRPVFPVNCAPAAQWLCPARMFIVPARCPWARGKRAERRLWGN